MMIQLKSRRKTSLPYPAVSLALAGLLVSGLSRAEVILLGQRNITDYLNNHNNRTLNGHFRQVENIDLSAYTPWEPVGTLARPMTLSFDGDGYLITGLNISTHQASTPTGLFGYLVDSWVKRVTLVRPFVLSQGS